MPPVSGWNLRWAGWLARLLIFHADKELPLAGVVLCFTSIVPEHRVSDTIDPGANPYRILTSSMLTERADCDCESDGS